MFLHFYLFIIEFPIQYTLCSYIQNKYEKNNFFNSPLLYQYLNKTTKFISNHNLYTHTHTHKSYGLHHNQKSRIMYHLKE